MIYDLEFNRDHTAHPTRNTPAFTMTGWGTFSLTPEQLSQYYSARVATPFKIFYEGCIRKKFCRTTALVMFTARTLYCAQKSTLSIFICPQTCTSPTQRTRHPIIRYTMRYFQPTLFMKPMIAGCFDTVPTSEWH